MKNMEYRLIVFFRKFTFLFSVFCILFTISSCEDDDELMAPKPRAYYRISFPEKKYSTYDSLCPFTFQVPSYAMVLPDRDGNSEPCWLNVEFPKFKGTLHLTYKPVKENILGYLKDTYMLASKHQIKASGMKEQLIKNDSSKIYGLIYDIQGNAATSFQFFITDSTNHFMHGSLYFNAVPNIDSVGPVVEFLKKDIYNMINTFKWKSVSTASEIPLK